MTLFEFEMPETGTFHILRSDPDQKTFEGIDNGEFYARSYCGGATVFLREGDLSALDSPQITSGDRPDMCKKCLKHAPVLHVTTDETEESADA